MRSANLLRDIVGLTFGQPVSISLHLGDSMDESNYPGYSRQTVSPDSWQIKEDTNGDSLTLTVSNKELVEFPMNRRAGVKYDRIGVWANSKLRYVFKLDGVVDISPLPSGALAPSFAPGAIINIETQ